MTTSTEQKKIELSSGLRYSSQVRIPRAGLPITQDILRQSMVISGEVPTNVSKKGFIVSLNGIYIGHHHDGGPFRGGTGEMYWQAITSDGTTLSTADSKSLVGGDGIFDDIRAGTWLHKGEFIPLYSTQNEPVNRALSLGFRLIENDDSAEAAKIFKGFGGLTKSSLELLSGVAGAGGAVGPLVDSVVGLGIDLMSLDGDDTVIQKIKGLVGPINNYNLGKFFAMKNSEKSAAIFSVVPNGIDDASRFYYKRSNTLIGKRTVNIRVPRDGQLSIFVHKHPYRHRAQFTLSGPGGVNTSGRFHRWAVRSEDVKAGNYKFEITNYSISPADLQILFTAK